MLMLPKKFMMNIPRDWLDYGKNRSVNKYLEMLKWRTLSKSLTQAVICSRTDHTCLT